MMNRRDNITDLIAALRYDPEEIHRAIRGMGTYADMGEAMTACL